VVRVQLRHLVLRGSMRTKRFTKIFLG